MSSYHEQMLNLYEGMKEVYFLFVNRKGPKVWGKDPMNEIVSFLDHGAVEKALHAKNVHCSPDKRVQVKMTLT